MLKQDNKVKPPNMLLIKFYIIIAIIVIILIISILTWFVIDMRNTANNYSDNAVELEERRISSKDRFMSEWTDSVEYKKNQSGIDNSSTSNNFKKDGISITGDQDTDNVDGYMVSWTYLCAIYETGSYDMACVQGHYTCNCSVGNISVPDTYSGSSVAHGIFQADSKYFLSDLLSQLVNAGYNEFSSCIQPDNSSGKAAYRSKDSREKIHGLFIKYRDENPVQFLADQMRIFMPNYLSEASVSTLEATLGKDRYSIHPAIIGTILSIDIYEGGGTSLKKIKEVTPSMTDEQIIDKLYEARGSTKQTNGIRNEEEHQAAIEWIQNGTYDIYQVNKLPSKGNIDLKSKLGL